MIEKLPPAVSESVGASAGAELGRMEISPQRSLMAMSPRARTSSDAVCSLRDSEEMALPAPTVTDPPETTRDVAGMPVAMSPP